MGVLCGFLVSSAVEARVASRVPYYGDEFYQIMSSGPRSEEMKDAISRVLKSAHQRTPNGMDRILPSCAGGDCYRHTSVGYNRARTFLLGRFYLVRRNGEYAVREVYCEREYDQDDFRGRKPGPDQIPDDKIVNTEHTWPQSRFSGRYPDDLQKADLHHLFPTDSQMNSIRSSHPFGEVDRDEMSLKCPGPRFGTSNDGRGLMFEPPESHQGNVARALFYFALRYDMRIDPVQEAFLRKWHREDPVDEEEFLRNDEIFKLQGSRNPFIDHPEVADWIRDF